MASATMETMVCRVNPGNGSERIAMSKMFGRSAGRTMSERDEYGTLTERTSHGVWRTLRDRSEGMMGDS